MLRELIKKNIQYNKDHATYVEVGYGQVEPNHLSAQKTGQIFAQLPAASNIEVLQQGQFVKYDYAKGLVNFEGAGEWMLVFNEIKLYHDDQLDCEFAMIKDNYGARVYSPLDGEKAQEVYGPTRFLQGAREEYKDGAFTNINAIDKNGAEVSAETVADFRVASKVHDYREFSDINDPTIEEDVRKRLFMKLRDYEEKMMPTDTSMVPRVLKTNVGDIFTTNTIKATTLEVGNVLTPNAEGILEVAAEGATGMLWQVVKVYTMPDHQKGVKIMRIQ